MKFVFLAVLWVVLSSLTYSAMLASSQSIGSNAFAARDCRSQMGFAAFIALLPPGWLVVPFLTGFYEHGLQFTCPRTMVEQ